MQSCSLGGVIDNKHVFLHIDISIAAEKLFSISDAIDICELMLTYIMFPVVLESSMRPSVPRSVYLMPLSFVRDWDYQLCRDPHHTAMKPKDKYISFVSTHLAK
jgi:hypothetical protein